ncbi:geranylgeranyl pyrophosphate synthetase [Penicillium brevicompactum]|uniref:Geranylgeranyl pyrophosphate synthetase n=1 Tax=Penicillium brevicompactum TaxID=5074 RepID=A0A9W9QY49_PENBR|nr:geranylgeranyl pyrophosphate synthetase [Penicillium brevicompactum]
MSDFKTTSEGIQEISRFSLEYSAPAEAKITDVRHLASYNWIEASTPTIAIPGSPAQCPLEPLFRSLYIDQPSFDINSIYIVTDRNNICKLLSFIKPNLSKKGLDAFTIQVDMTAQNAIFSRNETATCEVIGPGEFRGSGHRRIISYRLGGLSFLVCHETDGFVGDLKSSVKDDKSTGDNLANILNSLSLTPEKRPIDGPSVKSKLTIKREGRIASRESTLEIKTRVFHKPLELTEVAAQLWISQTPNLVRAHHQRGIFSTPKVEDVTGAMKDWEKTHQDAITKLVALIKCILRVTRNWGGRATVNYDPLKDKIVIKKSERKKVLSEDLLSRWEIPIPAKVTKKTSMHGPGATQKRPNTRRPTAVLDQDEVLPNGIKAEPAKLRRFTISALANEPESWSCRWKQRNCFPVLIGLYLISFLILVRSVLRLVEFMEEYSRYIMTHDVFVYVLDKLLMLIAMVDIIMYLPTDILGHSKTGIRQSSETILPWTAVGVVPTV